MAVHALRHRAHQKRRLFAGRVYQAYLRELRVQRLAEGRVPRRRRLIAGQSGVALNRQRRVQRAHRGLGSSGRHELAHGFRQEFGGQVKDPLVKRTPRRSRREQAFLALR